MAEPNSPPTQGQPRLERTDTPDQMQSGQALNPNDIVCRQFLNTGSRLGGTRVCKTRREWDAMRTNQQDGVMQTQRNGLQGTSPAG